MKHLLASVLMAASTFAASASTITVWEGSTKLTGWSDNVSVPASEFTAVTEGCQLVVNLTVDMSLDPSINYTNLGIKTNSEGWPELDGTSFKNPTESPATWDLNATAAGQLKATGLIVQGQNLVINSIQLVTADDVDPNLLFEGELVLSGWNSGATINPSKLKVGDALKYTFSAAGGSGAQVLVKNSNWQNLLGTSKITPSDMATGTVIVGVTAAMLENAGGSIFVQGDGGPTITKVERIPGAFDANGVVCYGERIPGVSIYATLSETTTQLAVVFAKKPKWAQLCNSGWGAIHTNDEATTVENPDGTATMTFTLTADDIAVINAKKEFVVNADANLLSVYIPGDTSAIGNVGVNEENAPVEYFNLQGIRVDNPENGLFIRRQGNKVSKVIIR